MQSNKQRIAVIGGGVTGLGACWLLKDHFDVTLYEKNDHLGGHTHTHDVEEGDLNLAIDSGFIVYNEKNYPNLVGLFTQLGVRTQATDMSFAFSLNDGELEYSGTGLVGMLAQRRNILRPRHWRLLAEIVRFNKVAHATLAVNDEAVRAQTLGEFLSQHQFSRDLQQHYLLPMGAAIWSCPVSTMAAFPAYSFLRFFANHGLIDLKDRPQWRTVVGGSREYVRKMMATMQSQITLEGAATAFNREGEQLTVNRTHYDKVIFACHADEALALLNTAATANEKTLLGAFAYEQNITYLHTDEALMPKRRRAWSSWNYLARFRSTEQNVETAQQHVTATYWMNHLQKFNAKKPYLVTLNPFEPPASSKIIKEMRYHHPIFNHAAIKAQPQLADIQGTHNCWFCGSYTGYGFHEDALASVVAVCAQLGVAAPWEQTQTQEGPRHGR